MFLLISSRYSREEYKCPTCAYTCTIEKAFFKHLRQDCEQATNSEGDPRISCPICGKDRDSEPLLMAHMVKHRCGKHFCCDLCKFRTLQMKKVSGNSSFLVLQIQIISVHILHTFILCS